MNESIDTCEVRLDYFHDDGRWRKTCFYNSRKKYLSQIWDEVEEMMATNPPGLGPGPCPFDVLITHPDGRPHIVRRRRE